MPRLQIPDKYQPGLAKIRKLGAGSVQAIRSALDQAPATTKPSDLATFVSSVSSAANAADFTQIGEVLGSLYLVKSASEVTVEQFAADICETLAADPQRLPSSERAEFEKKLITLLSAESFGVVSKAFDLATEDERIFHGARVLTDIRPVFGSDIEAGPKGAVIVHLLKIGYYESSKQHREFHVALDADDLKELKKAIERAESKAQSIKSKLKDVHFLGIS